MVTQEICSRHPRADFNSGCTYKADKIHNTPLLQMRQSRVTRFKVGLVCSGFLPPMRTSPSVACWAWMMSWLVSWKQQSSLLTNIWRTLYSLRQLRRCQVRLQLYAMSWLLLHCSPCAVLRCAVLCPDAVLHCTTMAWSALYVMTGLCIAATPLCMSRHQVSAAADSKILHSWGCTCRG